jgi:phosphoribosylformylglycinamidine synthase
LASFAVEAIASGLLSAAHDVSDGGVAQALVEMSLQGTRGARVDLGATPDERFVALFSESVARAIVTVTPANESAVVALAERHGVPVQRLGVVGGSSLEVTDGFSVSLDELRGAHEATLPKLFDHTND